jgi:DNA polymerase III alpha subunit
MGAIAITEHGNIDSHVKFETSAAKLGGVKPIFGCEVYMPTHLGDKDRREVPWYTRRAETQMKHHLTIIAKTRATGTCSRS